MKTINNHIITTVRRIFLLSSFLMMLVQIGSSQVYIEDSAADLSNLDVTEYDKELIYKKMNEVLNEYVNNASFISDLGQFSDEKYANFLGMFSGGAKVYNDILEKDGGNIDYAIYADNVYQYMQGTGVKFELNDIYLDKIDYDSGGFYVVTLSMEKLMLNGLNDKNIPVSYNNGRPFPIKMQIEMPDYDLEQASILSILGEEKRMSVDRSSMWTISALYSLGKVFKSNNEIFKGFENDIKYNTTYSSYGVESLYKISLDNYQKFWGVIGAQLCYNNYSVDLENYSSLEDLGIEQVVSIGGSTYYKFKEIITENTQTYSTFNALDSGLKENITVTAIEIPIGLSYNITSTYNYDFSVDLTLNPYYSISSLGSLSSTNDIVSYNIPSDTLKFPTELVSELFEPKNTNVLNNYKSTYKFDEITKTSNNFSLGIMLSPNFHYKFNYRLALELGANIQYNFLSMFNGENISGKTDQSLIRYASLDQEPFYTSTFQHYFKNVHLLRYGLKAGIVFKFN